MGWPAGYTGHRTCWHCSVTPYWCCTCSWASLRDADHSQHVYRIHRNLAWRTAHYSTIHGFSNASTLLSEGTETDKLIRALVGVVLFSAAYMAEVIRGGLQAIPKGQYRNS